ncbi:MAG: hypothetical protein KI793_26655 [Rivularia sp. (in: Bacteria)]|nr:hypothetical protein [Rivularia sp. MS3]
MRISAQQMSPHRIRHSLITTVLDKNNENYRIGFNCHAKPDTVIKYDDNRQKLLSSDDRYICKFGLRSAIKFYLKESPHTDSYSD